MGALCLLVSAFLILIVVRVVLSFVPFEESGVIGAISTIVFNITEPVLASVRRFMPQIGDIPIDFSPAIVMFALFFLRTLLGCG